MSDVHCLCGHPQGDHKMGRGPCKACDQFGCDRYEGDEGQVGIRPESAVPAEPKRVVEENSDGIAALLGQAERSGVPKMARASEKIRALIAELQDQVHQHAAEARLRAELADAEARVAELRARLKGGRAGDEPVAVDLKAVRAWAKTQGIEVAPHGLIRSSLIEQYRRAVA